MNRFNPATKKHFILKCKLLPCSPRPGCIPALRSYSGAGQATHSLPSSLLTSSSYSFGCFRFFQSLRRRGTEENEGVVGVLFTENFLEFSLGFRFPLWVRNTNSGSPLGHKWGPHWAICSAHFSGMVGHSPADLWSQLRYLLYLPFKSSPQTLSLGVPLPSRQPF